MRQRPKPFTKPGDVSADRIRRADADGKPRHRVSEDIFGNDALTHLPARPSRTPAQASAAALADADERRDASRGVARQVMLAGHGCAGSQCFSYAHGEHREVMAGALEALGLRDYQPGRGHGYVWGKGR